MMRHRRTLSASAIVALGTLVVLAGTALGQATGPGDNPPIVLHLADADPPGLQSEAEGAFFAQRVQQLSGGDMTVEIALNAAADVDQPTGPEVAVARMVEAGDFELGMTTARSWDLLGVTSLQALQTPFLIDDTALAVAVAKSDIADRALDGMSEVGLTGLALWPEHMRYLFAYAPTGKAFLTPQDIAGATLVAAFSASGRRYLTDLGAMIWDGDDAEGDSAAGRLQGGEFGFFNGPVNAGWNYATGNLALYPRTKVLFANGPAFAALSDRQRGILEQAALETRDQAVDHAPDEAAQAARHCGLDGHVAFATDEAVAAFHRAAQPTIDGMRADPLTAQLIDDITALKATTTSGPKPQPCDPPKGTERYPLADPTGFQATLPPAGRYRADLTVDGMVANGVDPRWAGGNQGVSTFTFTEDTVTFEAQNPDGLHRCVARATPTADGRAIHLQTDPSHNCDITMDFLWKPDGDGIRMIMSADPAARGTPAQIREHLNWRGWLEPVRWVRVP